MSVRTSKPKPKPKSTARKPAEVSSNTPQPKTFFPFARYTSIVGVHTSLLAFTALFLPRTSLAFLTQFSSEILKQRTSSDPSQVLTENPPRTVAWICVGTFILQAWWASWVRGWSLETQALTREGKDATSERAEHKLQRRVWNSGRLAAFLNSCLFTVLASIAFYIVIVLFGAPISSHPLHTYLLGLQVALLTVFAPVYTLGMPTLGSSTEALVRRLTWIRLFAELSPRTAIERATVYPAVGTLLGCWSGAIPIGLDWERPWQAWPLTPAYGALSGYIVGSIWALVVSATLYLAEADLVARRELQKQQQEQQSQLQGKKTKTT